MLFRSAKETIEIPSFWVFDDVGVIPFEAPLENLRLTIGAHDLETQILANKFYPCGVFNLSITPSAQIERTHEVMKRAFHSKGGPWTRSHMPRTVLVFHDKDHQKAKQKAFKAMETYWKAIEGTLDPEKVRNAVDNALVGDSAGIAEDARKRFHADDRLMLWFEIGRAHV